jgi:TRAP-type C4-dicarboxylate transport system substrate-binding protein
MRAGWATVVWILLTLSSARADRLLLKSGTVAPEGSTWARSFQAAASEIESATNGQVRFKFYFGGVAGDELEMGERVRRGELDGVVSGGPLCEMAAPTMNLLRLPGVFEDADESNFIIEQLLPVLEEEARSHGYVLLGTSAVGPDIFFTRKPVHSMAELQAARLWRWSDEPAAIRFGTALGMQITPRPVHEAARAFDSGATDGFWAIPQAAIAFGWSTQARYFLPDLRASFLIGCSLVSLAAWGRLSYEQQQIALSATVKSSRRLQRMQLEQDRILLGGLFQKQGLIALPVSEKLRADFYRRAREMRDHLDDKVVSRAMLERVQQLLFDYRNEHRRR